MSSTNHSRVVLLGVKSTFSLLVLFIITVIIHECVHYFTTIILGIPIEHFTWFDPTYFAPVFISVSEENTIGMTIVSYTGGLVTGILLLSILIIKRSWFKKSVYRWLLGFYIVAFGFWQVCQGILEGAFHQMYIASANYPLFSLFHYIGYATAFLGIFLYWLFMPRLKELKV